MEEEKSWRNLLGSEYKKPYFRELRAFLKEERENSQIYPPEDLVYSALKATPYERVKVLILGQDPYHGQGQAHGLAFSVSHGVVPPPSLQNIFKELAEDMGCPYPTSGCLTPWAEQGVLLLNAVLTVRASSPNSHQGKGWETFTDAVIRVVNEKDTRVVFVLWGSYAGKKAALIDTDRHSIIRSVHPSPLSAHRGFLGSKPFSMINAELERSGQQGVKWCLP